MVETNKLIKRQLRKNTKTKSHAKTKPWEFSKSKENYYKTGKTIKFIDTKLNIIIKTMAKCTKMNQFQMTLRKAKPIKTI